MNYSYKTNRIAADVRYLVMNMCDEQELDVILHTLDNNISTNGLSESE